MNIAIPNDDSNTILPSYDTHSVCYRDKVGPTAVLSMSHILQNPTNTFNEDKTCSVSSMSDSCDFTFYLNSPSTVSNSLYSNSESLLPTPKPFQRWASAPCIPSCCQKERDLEKKWSSASDLRNPQLSTDMSNLFDTLNKSSETIADNHDSLGAESSMSCPDFVHPGPSHELPSCENMIKSSVSDSVKFLPRKRQRTIGSGGRESLCPVCGLTVRATELESHYEKELKLLSNIPKNSRKSENYRSQSRRTRDGKRRISSESQSAKLKRKKTIKNLKSNRHERMLAKLNDFRVRINQTHVCAYCSASMQLSDEEGGLSVRLFDSPELEDQMSGHMHQNSSTSTGVKSCTVTGDMKDSDDEEEALFLSASPSPLNSPSVSGIDIVHGSTTTKITNNDNDLPVDVETDDTQTYGDIQYTNHDLILASESIGLVADMIDQVSEESKPFNFDSSAVDMETDDTNCSSELEQKSDKVIIDILKKRIKFLEAKERHVPAKCLICMDSFNTPLVSINCWHVHCKECWLKTMVMKSLCPQCNLIVLPKDLRRIYL